MRRIYALVALCTIQSALSASEPFAPQTRSDNYIKLLASTPASVTFQGDFSELSLSSSEIDGGLFSHVSLSGEPTTMNPGKPALPSVARFVIVPPASNIELVVTASEPRREHSPYPPALYVAEKGCTVSSVDDGDIFPPVIAEMGKPFIIRGVRMVKVTTYPVRYDSETNDFLFYDHVETEVRSVAGEAVNPVMTPERPIRDPEFRKYLENFAVNGPALFRDDPERDRAPENEGKYLIVTHSGNLEWIIPFIEFRRKVGYEVDIIAVDDGRDAGAVQEVIQNHYDQQIDGGVEPFQYLLLVGDYQQYDYAQDIGNVIAALPGQGGWRGDDHADYPYACLEGEDLNPDVAWGRWPAGSEGKLTSIVSRQLAMSATPPLDNPEYYRRAAVYSQHYGNSASSEWTLGLQSNVRWAEEVMKRRFSDVRFYENLDWDQIGNRIGPFIRDQLNAPVSLMAGRAELYYYTERNPAGNNFQNDVHENTFFPVNLCLSGQGQFVAQVMFRQVDPNHLKSYVATTTGYGYSSPGIFTAMWMELVDGVVQKDMPLGWGWNYASNMSQRFFPDDMEDGGHDAISVHRTDSNLWGDPAYRPWMSVPRSVEMVTTEDISPQTRLVEANVTDAETGEPVQGATVTLYAPGAIPLDDPADYAEYNGMVQKVALSDADGQVRFLLPEEDGLVDGTEIYLTASGRDIAPCFVELEIGERAASVEVSNWFLTQVAGNGDAFPNPNETFELNITARNSGQSDAVQDLTATVVTSSPFIQIEDQNQIDFGDLNVGEEREGNSPVVFSVAPDCPDAEARPVLAPELLIEFSSGDQVWRSGLKLDVHAPHLEFRSVVGGSIIPDSTIDLDLEIVNIGRVSSGALTAGLSSTGRGVAVGQNVSRYDAIAPGNTARLSGDNFEVNGTSYVIPGSKVTLSLTLENRTGFIDTTLFDLQVMEHDDQDPIGPDKYGYICFDDSDNEWQIAPEYDWIEINPDLQEADFEGEIIDFAGITELDIGEARLIDLGFETTFYGETFDQITVGTNGFICMGDQPRITNHQRWPMDAAIGGGAGMISPFWNDLKFQDDTKVLYYYDEDRGRMIVEWYHIGFINAENDVTFEAVLYDRELWMSESGDQQILFQYQTISNPSNIRRNEAVWTNGCAPFASVGISSPDGTTGVNYTWNDIYPTGAAPLEDGRAILFATSPNYKTAILHGRVTDLANGNGIEDVRVVTGHGVGTSTDAEGYWRLASILAEIPVPIRASKEGYNDTTLVIDPGIDEGDSLEINFELLHPEFVLSHQSFEVSLFEGMQQEEELSITNTGNGPLNWTAEKRNLGGQAAEQWELRRSFNVSQITNDDRIEGVVFGFDRFFLSGANGNDSNMIYVLSRDGELVDSFPQINSSRYGYKDMEWDNGLIWACGEENIYALDTDGQVIHQWDDPMNPSQYVAVDERNGIIYLSGTTTNIVRCDREGNLLNGNLSRLALRIYGLAYFPDDPDGYNLYIVNRPEAQNSFVSKMNVLNGDTTAAFQFPLVNESAGMQSACITRIWDLYSWVLMSINNISSNGGGDRLEIRQLANRLDWLQLDTYSGEIAAGDAQDLILTLDATELPDTTFTAEFIFRHNAEGGEAHLEVTLDVQWAELRFFNLLEPADGDTIVGQRAGEDSTIRAPVQFVWEQPPLLEEDEVFRYNLHLQARNWERYFACRDTFLTVDADTIGLPMLLDNELIWDVTAESQWGLQAFCEEPFHLRILTLSAIDDPEMPVEFGINAVYPQPFNSIATVKYGIEVSGEVSLKIYDMQGRLVGILADGNRKVGSYSLTWDADQVGSGVYFLRLESAGQTSIQKVALIR